MKNIAASVRDRLQKIARETQTDFQLLLIRYFQERMLLPKFAPFRMKTMVLFFTLTQFQPLRLPKKGSIQVYG